MCGPRELSRYLATRYGLDGPGNESRWGQDFPQPSRPVLARTQPSVQCVRLRRGLNHTPPSSAEVKETVELYLYSPSGPSRSVLERALRFTVSSVQRDTGERVNTLGGHSICYCEKRSHKNTCLILNGYQDTAVGIPRVLSYFVRLDNGPSIQKRGGYRRRML
jgi:hypothetical protein